MNAMANKTSTKSAKAANKAAARRVAQDGAEVPRHIIGPQQRNADPPHRRQRHRAVVIPGFMPGIHLSAGSGVCGWVDPGDKHRDDRNVFARYPFH